MARYRESLKYVCVIDFEATCIENAGKNFYPHEIIEFPCVIIDIDEHKIVSTFHSFVKPTLNPVLSDFCKNLTGITQDSINNAETFDLVFPKFLEWINTFLTTEDSFAVLTDGSFDMSRFLYLQCLISHFEFPSWAEKFIDIKQTYRKYKKCKEKRSLTRMLQSYGLEFDGKLHSGKDDAYNISQLALAMLSSGCHLRLNSHVDGETKSYLKKHLALYLKKAQKNKNRPMEPRKEEASIPADLKEVNTEMDIDPDVIGCESILMKFKRT